MWWMLTAWGADVTEDHRCKADVVMTSEGVPESVSVRDCPELFHASVDETLMKWRWSPPGVRAKTTIAVLFEHESKREAKQRMRAMKKLEKVRAKAAEL
jgi:uncharacterized membrane protein